MLILSNAQKEVVLKIYEEGATDDSFAAEVSIFKRLRPEDYEYIVKYLGSFVHGKLRIIIMEYADMGNLDEYYQKVEPPSKLDELADFWHGLLDLLQSLQCLHSQDHTGPVVHQDIKPTNILVFGTPKAGPHGARFKLTDFGKAHIPHNFVRVRSGTEPERPFTPNISNRVYSEHSFTRLPSPKSHIDTHHRCPRNVSQVPSD